MEAAEDVVAGGEGLDEATLAERARQVEGERGGGGVRRREQIAQLVRTLRDTSKLDLEERPCV